MKVNVYLEKKKIEKIKYDDKKTEGKSDEEVYAFLDGILREEVSDHKKLRDKTWYWHFDLDPKGGFMPCITIFIDSKITTLPVKLQATEEELGDLEWDMAHTLGKSKEEVRSYYEKFMKEQFSDHEKLKGKDWSWEQGVDWNTGVPVIYVKINE